MEYKVNIFIFDPDTDFYCRAIWEEKIKSTTYQQTPLFYNIKPPPSSNVYFMLLNFYLLATPTPEQIMKIAQCKMSFAILFDLY